MKNINKIWHKDNLMKACKDAEIEFVDTGSRRRADA
jgi:hypothetical protein